MPRCLFSFAFATAVATLLLCGCHAAGDAPGGGVLALDDVSNGLVEESRGSAEPGANPLAGAFYGDGGSGDVRARTENYFDPELGSRGTKPAAAAKERMLIQRGEIRVEV